MREIKAHRGLSEMDLSAPRLELFSDVHLNPAEKAIDLAFSNFLTELNQSCQTIQTPVFILGDLFETWIGDDIINTHNPWLDHKISLLQSLAQITPVFFIHGNRDFLIHETFESTTGIRCLPESLILRWQGIRILLCHGDHLCTQDKAYMAFRTMVRSQVWQTEFLAQSLAQRESIAAQIRMQSKQSTPLKHADALDICPQSTAYYLQQFKPNLFIHGHTHKPALHHEHNALRIVLGDWNPQASWLELNSDQGSISGQLTAHGWSKTFNVGL